MTDLRIIASDGGDAILEEAAVQAFADGLRGRLLRPGDGGYDEARKVWNGMIDRRPALIARCAGVADVIAAVRFARAHELLVSVARRRPQHHRQRRLRGRADDRPVADEGRRVDPVKRTARAEAGLTWGEYNHETQAFGLASTGGVVSTTGIAGLTLGGGLGWLHGQARPQLRQPAVGRSRHRRGRVPDRQCGAASGPLLGAARRRRQFRRRHLVRVSSCIRSARCWPAWSSTR